jgi:hypothetical protein
LVYAGINTCMGLSNIFNKNYVYIEKTGSKRTVFKLF